MEQIILHPIRSIELLVAFSLLVQSVELLMIRASYNESGIWRWSNVREEFARYPRWFRGLLDLTLKSGSFEILQIFRILLAISCFFVSTPAAPVLLFVLSLLSCLRWRGTFNGGSDYMTLLVLWVLSLAKLFAEFPQFVYLCLAYLAIQLVMSYFVAGVVKLRSSAWRNGRALHEVLSVGVYRAEVVHSYLERFPLIFTALTWAVIVFELSFPLSLYSQNVCVFYILLAMLFHLGNAYLLGLNRFFFAWLAAYPALLFCALSFNA